jgi:predicted metalloprotease
MRLDDLRPSDNVEDRRGEDYGGGGFGMGPRMVFGGGGLGLVAVLLISLFFGVDPSQLLNGGGPVPQRSQRQDTRPCAQDADCDFARRVIGSAEDVWQPLLRQQGVNFRPAVFTPYDYATPTGCGTGQSSAGPFYCPSDEHIYLDLSFFQELSQRFGAPGEFARAYVIAHEYGHHIQTLTGAMDRGGMGSMGPRGPEQGADSQSVRTERRHAAERKPGLYRARLLHPWQQRSAGALVPARPGRRPHGRLRYFLGRETVSSFKVTERINSRDHATPSASMSSTARASSWFNGMNSSPILSR